MNELFEYLNVRHKYSGARRQLPGHYSVVLSLKDDHQFPNLSSFQDKFLIYSDIACKFAVLTTHKLDLGSVKIEP